MAGAPVAVPDMVVESAVTTGAADSGAADAGAAGAATGAANAGSANAGAADAVSAGTGSIGGTLGSVVAGVCGAVPIQPVCMIVALSATGASSPTVMISSTAGGSTMTSSPMVITSGAATGRSCGAGVPSAAAGWVSAGAAGCGAVDRFRSVGPDSPRPQTGQAPLPWFASTFSAMAICCSRVARLAAGAY